MYAGSSNVLCEQAAEKTELSETLIKALADKLTNDGDSKVRTACAQSLGKAHMVSFDVMCAHVEIESNICDQQL